MVRSRLNNACMCNQKKQTKKKHEYFRNLNVINVNEIKSSEKKQLLFSDNDLANSNIV